jgi:hypothetical protein
VSCFIAIPCFGVSLLLFIVGHAFGVRWLRLPLIAIAVVSAPIIAMLAVLVLYLGVGYAFWLLGNQTQIYDASNAELTADRVHDGFYQAASYDGILRVRPFAARTIHDSPDFICFRHCTDRYDYAAYCLTPEQFEKLPVTRHGWEQGWSPEQHPRKHPYAPKWFIPLELSGTIHDDRVFRGRGCEVFIVSGWSI